MVPVRAAVHPECQGHRGRASQAEPSCWERQAPQGHQEHREHQEQLVQQGGEHLPCRKLQRQLGQYQEDQLSPRPGLAGEPES